MATPRTRQPRRPKSRPPPQPDSDDLCRAIDHAMSLFGVDSRIHPAFVADELSRRFPGFAATEIRYVTGLAQGRMAERLDLLQRMPGATLLELRQ